MYQNFYFWEKARGKSLRLRFFLGASENEAGVIGGDSDRLSSKFPSYVNLDDRKMAKFLRG
ncbi:MAG: hypothetical protein MGF17_00540 [Trichodesmium sp. MAG_R04]|nr:hypothetical protein [Trichodesmium sp. MAG_R04]